MPVVKKEEKQIWIIATWPQAKSRRHPLQWLDSLVSRSRAFSALPVKKTSAWAATSLQVLITNRAWEEGLAPSQETPWLSLTGTRFRVIWLHLEIAPSMHRTYHFQSMATTASLAEVHKSRVAVLSQWWTVWTIRVRKRPHWWTNSNIRAHTGAHHSTASIIRISSRWGGKRRRIDTMINSEKWKYSKDRFNSLLRHIYFQK